tara:strand:+ start:952 stop:1206 length:255 start_codon:yes stop_codon:yes gene_type:complete
MKNIQQKTKGYDTMSESKDYENEAKYEVVRVTSLKTNGSVWTKQYDGNMDWNKVIPLLLKKFPHIILSKQTLKEDPMTHLMNME